jgi:hypothetical protein
VHTLRYSWSYQVLRDAPGFSHGDVSRCLRSRQSIWCSPQGWDTPGFSHGEDVTTYVATSRATRCYWAGTLPLCTCVTKPLGYFVKPRMVEILRRVTLPHDDSS